MLITRPRTGAAAKAPAHARLPERRPNAQLIHAVLQRKSARAAGSGSGGMAGPSEAPAGAVSLAAFPHGTVIGRQLGRALPSTALLDPAGCAGRGVPAFTRNGEAHFSSANPPLHVAAHEAAHVLQQRGATRDMGLGAEGHAAAIERRVGRGAGAASLLGDVGARVDGSERRYTEVAVAAQAAKKWNAGLDLRVSDDGNMAVGQDAAQHSFWATATKVAASNATLKTVGSAIRLELQSESLIGKAPSTGGARSLTKVLPKNLMTGTSGEAMTLWADCGNAGRDVMGAGTAGGGDAALIAAKYKISVHQAGAAKPKIVTRNTVATDPEDMKKEIFSKKFNIADGAAALAHYDGLPAADRDKADRELGINRYAAPATGQGFTMSSGGADFAGENTWNFHWAGVVMTSGSDRVTLENYAVGDASVKNTEWEFQMYGPASKAGQTFHEQHFDTHQHGQTPTTMTVGKR